MTKSKGPSHVVVHPLVLLSVTDHYTRVAKDTKKRVVGVLLGEVSKGVVEVTNSYAVPFEEDERDASIWFLDFGFHENMFAMFKKVNAKEKVVGWYSTGPKIRAADIDIHQSFNKYTPNPVYVIVDVQPKEIGIPTNAYTAIEEAEDVSSQPKLTFGHLSSEIGAMEAEEVGVGHLLRDVVQDNPAFSAGGASSLMTDIQERLTALRALQNRLQDIQTYLNRISENKLPVQHSIIYKLQDIFNLLPGLHSPAHEHSHTQAHTQQAIVTHMNDTMLSIFVSCISRSIIALHNLINNKLQLKEQETKATQDAQKEKEKKEKGTEKTKEDGVKEKEKKK